MKQIPNNEQAFTMTIKVLPGDIDEQNHVNNVVYVRWVQEVALAHWLSIASEQLRNQCKWVVLRHEVDYFAPALPGEEIIARTWVDIPQGPRQTRHVSFHQQGDQKTLAMASTWWCLLDSLTGKPKRVLPEITEAFGLKN